MEKTNLVDFIWFFFLREILTRLYCRVWDAENRKNVGTIVLMIERICWAVKCCITFRIIIVLRSNVGSLCVNNAGNSERLVRVLSSGQVAGKIQRWLIVWVIHRPFSVLYTYASEVGKREGAERVARNPQSPLYSLRNRSAVNVFQRLRPPSRFLFSLGIALRRQLAGALSYHSLSLSLSRSFTRWLKLPNRPLLPLTPWKTNSVPLFP